MSEHTAIPSSLKNFDSLPDSALVRQPVVKALLGISDTTLWRRVKDGSLRTVKPSPRVVAFRVGDLRAYLNTKQAA